MSRVQRVQGDLTLDPSGSINLNSNTTVTGNLTVAGTTTTISTTNTEVADRVIKLNDGESGSGVTGRYSGLEFDRGSANNALLVFDENDDKFKISTDGGSSYSNLLVTSTSGLTEVVDDTTPQLGGNIDTNEKSIVTVSNRNVIVAPNGTGTLQVGAPIQLTDQSAPSSVSGATLIYANTAAGGGTGVFFVDGTTSDELVSKSKAIVYGLIF
tara:strand:- start:1040 stop:1675 length:636 start_codon:yes stop_codon:yes gene_type:complete